MSKNIEHRIKRYIELRSINPRKVSRRMHKNAGDVLFVSDVKALIAMIRAGGVESFFDEYDKLVEPTRMTTSTSVRSALSGLEFSIPAPPDRRGCHRPTEDHTTNPPE